MQNRPVYSEGVPKDVSLANKGTVSWQMEAEFNLQPRKPRNDNGRLIGRLMALNALGFKLTNVHSDLQRRAHHAGSQCCSRM